MIYRLEVVERNQKKNVQILQPFKSRQQALNAFSILWPRADTNKVESLQMYEDDLLIAYVSTNPFYNEVRK